jgi:hypothetical protein
MSTVKTQLITTETAETPTASPSNHIGCALRFGLAFALATRRAP